MIILIAALVCAGTVVVMDTLILRRLDRILKVWEKLDSKLEK